MRSARPTGALVSVRSGRLVVACALAVLLGAACQQARRPVVKQQTFSAAAGSLRVVAVMPFSPSPDLRFDTIDGGPQPEEIATLVTTFFAEALMAQGIRIVTPSDIELAYSNAGRAVQRRDPRAAAELVTPEFGATSLVLGQVSRRRVALAHRRRALRSWGADEMAKGFPDGRGRGPDPGVARGLRSSARGGRGLMARQRTLTGVLVAFSFEGACFR